MRNFQNIEILVFLALARGDGFQNRRPLYLYPRPVNLYFITDY
jgi:hypothetical protein